ncbi:MAG: alcohol dehydrogenase [Lacrimispora celerecrescens]|uniref:zinc-dependent alcohol dehydrogenase n=1 Tax=Lacrimispora indolis TaxID=69825 RepID=UPI00042767F3|nr:zinc-binding dehydrogenase [[Clostridium] methoxybenzovorans]MBE7722351.1 alcohol dehydrogenase [Lacrimispora celerecrescens]
MKAIVLEEPGKSAIKEVELPPLKEDEVLLRIVTSGICTNDVRDFNGECNYSYPRIGGHEYCGIIEETGSNVNSRCIVKGQKAVTYIIDDCKICYYCKHGEENICEGLPQTKTFQNPDGLSGYGGFAEYVICKANDVFIYPKDVSFETMAFTEPLACVVNSIHRTDIQFGDDVLVIGGGAMGLLHVMAARLKGARVILSEPLEQRRNKALGLGCHAVIDPINADAVQEVKKLTEGRGARIVFNTTASPAVAKQAVEMTAPGGTCVMFSSLHPNDPVQVNMGAVHSYQITVTGAVSPTIKAYQQSTLLLGKGLLDPTPLIEGIYDYRDFDAAMKAAAKTESYKVLLKFGE